MRVEIFVAVSTILFGAAGAKIRCRYHEFACASGWQCITATKFCDGTRDCRDGSDERYQRNALSYVQRGIPCRQYRLICMLPESQKAKKNFICRKDELCQEYEFVCEDGSGCLPPLFYCDGTPDCRDGSDEIYRKLPMDPEETRTPCRFHKFICMLPESQESKRDIFCTKGLECNEQEFECEDGSACIPSYSFCDGSDIPWTDCRDRSDEKLRVLPLDPSETGIPCRRHHDICLLPKNQESKKEYICTRDVNCGKEFACEDGTRCLPAAYFCDNANDPEWRNCRDRSDERLWVRSKAGSACRQYKRTCLLPTNQESKTRKICKKNKKQKNVKGKKRRRNRKSKSG